MNKKWSFEMSFSAPLMNFEDNDEIIGDKETLSCWLYTDVKNNSLTLDFIDKAILGELKDNLFWGNCYKTYIGQEFTEIYYNFEDEDPTIKPCKLPTRLLREIVEAWLEEYEKFRNKKK